MTATVSCTVYPDVARTLVIPAGLAGQHRTQWHELALATIVSATGHWGAPSDELIPDIIDHAIELRGSADVLVLQLWSASELAVGTVRVAAQQSPGLAVIAEQLRAQSDSRVEQISAATLGSGREWVFGEALPGESAEQLMGLQCCFADDELLITITLEATLPGIFLALVDEVRALIGGMEIEVGGRSWQAQDIGADVGTRADLEEWPELLDQA